MPKGIKGFPKGKSNMNWKNALVTKRCKICNEEFSFYKSALKYSKRLCCSRECVGISRRNIPLSQKHKDKISKANKGHPSYSTIQGACKIKKSLREYYRTHPNAQDHHKTPKYRKRIGLILKKYHQEHPESKAFTQTKEYRDKMSLAVSGKKNGMYGRKQKLSTKRKIGLKNIAKWKDLEYKQEMKEKAILASKKRWQDPKYHLKQVQAIFRGLLKRPTSFEKVIIDLIKKYRLPYKYTGDGSFLIGYKNPDFVEINGKKICIEVFHNYFKERDYGSIEEYKKQRSIHFAKYGWKTIFIDGNEIKNKDRVLSKI